MHVSTRSYLTAGIAALSAGAVSLAPVQPLPQASAVSPELTTAAVQLAAAIDPITPIITTIQATANNLTDLVDNWGANPLPVLQQRLTNVGTFLGELPDLSLILGQILGNVGNALRAPGAVPASCVTEGEFCETISAEPFDPPLVPPPLDAFVQNRQYIWALLPAVLGADAWIDTYQAIFVNTVVPISGLLLGLVGPVLAPVVALTDSIGAAFSALGNSNILGAINELINIPTNMINAFFNGGPVLNLTPLGSLIGLPASIKSIGLTMGGLFSPGGVLFDALNVTAEAEGFGTLAIPGLPVGPLGSIYKINQAVAKAITVTPPAPGASRASAAAVAAAPEETAPEVTPAVDSPEPVALTLDAAPAGEKAASPKRASSRHGDAKSSATGKAGASRQASRARAAAND